MGGGTHLSNRAYLSHASSCYIPCLPPSVQCNHRSWADFFLDIYLTEGLAAPMSRAMVYFAFPVFVTSVIALKGIILFKRGTIADKDVSWGGRFIVLAGPD